MYRLGDFTLHIGYRNRQGNVQSLYPVYTLKNNSHLRDVALVSHTLSVSQHIIEFNRFYSQNMGLRNPLSVYTLTHMHLFLKHYQ